MVFPITNLLIYATLPLTLQTTVQIVGATTQSQDKPNVTATTSLSAIFTSVCLLKTAITNVSARQTNVEGHILFDKGAQYPSFHRTLQ